MAKILVKFAQATTRALAVSKLGQRMMGFVSENNGSLVLRSEANENYDFLSKQYLSLQSNNAAADIGVLWNGSASQVQAALNELKDDVDSINLGGLNPRGPWISGTNYAVNDLVEYQGSTYICFFAIDGSTTTPDADAGHFYLFAGAGAGDGSVDILSDEAEVLAFLSNGSERVGIVLGEVEVSVPVDGGTGIPERLDINGTKTILGGKLYFNIANPATTERWQWFLSPATKVKFLNDLVSMNYDFLKVESLVPGNCEVFVQTLGYETLTLRGFRNEGAIPLCYGSFVASDDSTSAPWFGPKIGYWSSNPAEKTWFDPSQNNMVRTIDGSTPWRRSNRISNFFEFISFLFCESSNEFATYEEYAQGWVEPDCATFLLGEQNDDDDFLAINVRGGSKSIDGATIRGMLYSSPENSPLKFTGYELDLECDVAIQGDSTHHPIFENASTIGAVVRVARLIGASSVTANFTRNDLPPKLVNSGTGAIVYGAVLNGTGLFSEVPSTNSILAEPVIDGTNIYRISPDGSQSAPSLFVCQNEQEFILALAAELDSKTIILAKNLHVFGTSMGHSSTDDWTAFVYGTCDIIGSCFIGSFPTNTMTYKKTVGAGYASMRFIAEPTGLSITGDVVIDGVIIRTRRLSPAGTVTLTLLDAGSLIYQSMYVDAQTPPAGSTQAWWYDAEQGGGGSAALKDAIFVKTAADLEAALKNSTVGMNKLIVATAPITVGTSITDIYGYSELITPFGLGFGDNLSFTGVSPSSASLTVYGSVNFGIGTFTTDLIELKAKKISSNGIGSLAVTGTLTYELKEGSNSITGAGVSRTLWDNTVTKHSHLADPNAEPDVQHLTAAQVALIPPQEVRFVTTEPELREALMDQVCTVIWLVSTITLRHDGDVGNLYTNGYALGTRSKHLLGSNLNFQAGNGTTSFYYTLNPVVGGPSVPADQSFGIYKPDGEVFFPTAATQTVQCLTPTNTSNAFQAATMRMRGDAVFTGGWANTLFGSGVVYERKLENGSLTAVAPATLEQAFPFDTSEGKVAVSSTDTIPKFLGDKLIAGTNITLTVVDPGDGSQQMQIDATGGDSLWENTTVGTDDDVLKPITDHRTFLIGDEAEYDPTDSGKSVFIPNPTGTDAITVTGADYIPDEGDGTYAYVGIDPLGFAYWYNTAKAMYLSHSDSPGAPWYCISPTLNPTYFNALYVNFASEQQPVGTFTGINVRAYYSPVAVQSGVSSGRSIRSFGVAVFDTIKAMVSQIASIIPLQKTQAEIDALPHIEGRLVYNADEHNWESDGFSGGTHLAIGRELWERCKNTDTVPVTNGMAVFVATGSPTNDEIEIKRAKADNDATLEPIIGLVTEDSIAVGGFGEVTTYGKVRGMNTSALAIGPVYISASTAGGLTSTKPAGANLVKCIGFCTRVHANQGVVFVCPKPADHLADLHDVLDGTPTAGNMLIANGFGWTSTDAGDQIMSEIGDATKDPTGFDDSEYGVPMQSVVQMSFNVGTSTFTIAPKAPYTSYHYWYRGRKIPVTTSKTLSCPFNSGTTRNWWIVWDGSLGTLKAFSALPDGAYTIIRDNCFVAELIWNFDGTALMKASFEAHGSSMSWMNHLRDHSVDGTKYQTGGLVTPIDATKSIGVEACTVWDEDIKWVTTAITQGAANSISAIWRQGTSWNGARFTSGVAVGGTGRPVYNNELVPGNWTTSEILANEWVNGHIFTTPDFDGNEVFMVVGQAKYATIAAARAGIETEILSLATQGLPFPEYKSLASVCIDASTNGWTFTPVTVGGAMIIDWRDTTAGRAVTSLTQDHGSLTGLADNDHPQYGLVAGGNAWSGNQVITNGYAAATAAAGGGLAASWRSDFDGPVDVENITNGSTGSLAAVGLRSLLNWAGTIKAAFRYRVTKNGASGTLVELVQLNASGVETALLTSTDAATLALPHTTINLAGIPSATIDLTKMLFFAAGNSMKYASIDTTFLKRADGSVNALTTKTTPVGADVLLIEDSAASYTQKKILISSLPSSGGASGLVTSPIFGRTGLINAPAMLTLNNVPVLNNSALGIYIPAASTLKKVIVTRSLAQLAASGITIAVKWATPPVQHAYYYDALGGTLATLSGIFANANTYGDAYSVSPNAAIAAGKMVFVDVTDLSGGTITDIAVQLVIQEN